MGRDQPGLLRAGRRHPADQAARVLAPHRGDVAGAPGCGSPTCSTPATAICTRWCSTTSTVRGPGRAGRAAGDRDPRAVRRRRAVRSPASTASAATRPARCRRCSPTSDLTVMALVRARVRPRQACATRARCCPPRGSAVSARPVAAAPARASRRDRTVLREATADDLHAHHRQRFTGPPASTRPPGCCATAGAACCSAARARR